MEITTFLPVRWKAERTDFTFLVPNALIPEILVLEFSVLHSETSRVPRRRLHGSSESQAGALSKRAGDAVARWEKEAERSCCHCPSLQRSTRSDRECSSALARVETLRVLAALGVLALRSRPPAALVSQSPPKTTVREGPLTPEKSLAWAACQLASCSVAFCS